MKKLIIVLISILFFCGCSNYSELNNLAIITGMAIDLDDDGYRVSVLISNSQKASESTKEGDAGTVVYSGNGSSISESLKKIDTQIPKKLYFNHLAVVVISEEIAKDKIEEIADYFSRSPESTKRFYLTMANNEKAENIIKILTPLETFPSQTVKLNIESTNENTAISTKMTYSEFIENFLKKGSDPYLPTIGIKGKPEKGDEMKNLESSELKANIELKSLALFNGTKFVGYADDNESRGINIINGKIDKMIIPTKCNNDEIIMAISDLKSKKSIKFINNKPIINITINANAAIQEVTCKIDLTNPKQIELIEKNTESKIKYLMIKGINKSKELKTDVFGFGNIIYKHNPKYYNSIKNWDNEFNTINTNIKVNVNLMTKGAIKQSIKEAKSE